MSGFGPVAFHQASGSGPSLERPGWNKTRRMANRSNALADCSDAHACSEAVSSIRSRRGTEDPDSLLDEALALLDSLPETRPAAARRRVNVAAIPQDPFPEVDGGSPEIRRLKLHMLRIAGDPDVTVLILGESGTGKERVARAIHRASPRSRAPFVVVNCAGLSPTLIEDQLFGHVRGAFTGAVEDQPGPFERAGGGTVLLDEVGDLTSDLQMKLLRALQHRTVQRLGSGQETPFDVRVIAATNVDLAAAKSRGRFREDLYYRLKVYEVYVPPLRRRGAGDIKALTRAILARFAERRRRPPPVLDAETLDLLVRYSWPGNVRELENTLECMIVAAGTDSSLTSRYLPEGFAGMDTLMPSAARRGRWTLPSAGETTTALEQNDFKLGRTAAALGMSRHQLYRLLKRHGLAPRGGPA
jgi:transcriptional regulator with PAS, ATPase and Fis domain